MKTTQVTPYSVLPNSTVQAADGISYAYRDTGGHDGSVPLVLLQHFRGNLDYWDPALIDALAPSHRIITFGNAGVGNSTGTTPDTIEQMARDAIAFLTALDLGQADLLGFPSAVSSPRRSRCGGRFDGQDRRAGGGEKPKQLLAQIA